MSGRSAKTGLVFKPRTMLSICAALPGVLISHRSQVLMDELYGISAFAYTGSDAFDGAVTDVAGDEDAGHTGFEEPGLACERPAFGHFPVGQQIGASQDEALVIALDDAGEPLGARG